MLPVEEAMKPLLPVESFPVVLLLVVTLPLVLKVVVPVVRFAHVSNTEFVSVAKINMLNLII
jgi:uncharacterized membrane protein